MSLHPKTIMGFLTYWGPKATEEELGIAIGILLTALAKRGTKEALDTMVRVMGPQEQAGRA